MAAMPHAFSKPSTSRLHKTNLVVAFLAGIISIAGGSVQ